MTPSGHVAELRDALPVGSHIVITHVVFDSRPDVAEPIVTLYRKFAGAR